MYRPYSDTYQYFLLRREKLSVSGVLPRLYKKTKDNTVTLRDFFRMFDSVCGTTATAVSFEEELKELYGLEYMAIPTNNPCRRQVFQTPVYTTLAEKLRSIVALVEEKQATGQPVLLVTKDVGESLSVSKALELAGIPHKLVNADNAKDLNRSVMAAGKIGSVFISTALVNRGVDIKLGGDPELQTRRDLVELGVDTSELSRFLQGGADPDASESELYKKYRSILKKNRLLAAEERRRVRELGGLCVIATSFFGDMRTEQQTLGRSGRQGEPGECHLFRSYQDGDLLRLLDESLASRMERMGVSELDYRFQRYAFTLAQRRLHDFDFKQIRESNGRQVLINEARPDFIGWKQRIQNGGVEPREILKRWAEASSTRTALKAIIDGEKISDKPFLSRVAERGSELYGRVSRLRSERVLLEISYRVLFDGRENEKKEELFYCTARNLVDAWGEYVRAVEAVAENEGRVARTLRKTLEEEKSRLLTDALEMAFLAVAERSV